MDTLIKLNDNEINYLIGNIYRTKKLIDTLLSEHLQIKIKYLVPGLKALEQHGDWIDLRAAQDYSLNPGDKGIIRLGVAMELPEGYEAHVLPRSSTFKKYGIIMTNSMGIIDNDYHGNEDEWGFPFYATDFAFIPKNTRIAQFRVVRTQGPIIFDVVADLELESRGGFGSTGEE